MSADEDAHWSKTFTNAERVEKRQNAQKAAKELRRNRENFSLYKYFGDRKDEIQDVLVLGCGGGRAERALHSKGIGSHFHGVDIAEGAVNDAKKIANKQNLPITYEVADLNKVILKPKSYDMVSANNFLHHIVDLEHLFEQIWKSLKPNGYLYIQDFVGETQFQWQEKRLKITTDLLNILPDKFKKDNVKGDLIKMPKRPNPGRLCSPFEAIRSGDIIPVLKKWFDVDKDVSLGSIRYHVLPLTVMENYVENEDTKTVFEVLRYVDKLLVDEGVLPPTATQMVLRKKPFSEVKGN